MKKESSTRTKWSVGKRWSTSRYHRLVSRSSLNVMLIAGKSRWENTQPQIHLESRVTCSSVHDRKSDWSKLICRKKDAVLVDKEDCACELWLPIAMPTAEESCLVHVAGQGSIFDLLPPLRAILQKKRVSYMFKSNIQPIWNVCKILLHTKSQTGTMALSLDINTIGTAVSGGWTRIII